ncbi:glycosyltransferase family 2 protein [Halioglobus pacificus]|nr:glycosyltransferase family 2 protein [Halioglobus pacificus]
MLTSLDVVVPVYGCPEALPTLVHRLEKVLSEVASYFQIILVDDRCPKGSWEEIVNLKAGHTSLVGIRLSRNFGQHNAITAGLEHSTSDWVVVMDCDLQDPPEEIRKLADSVRDGDVDIVFAKRHQRKDGFLKRKSSRVFHGLLSALAGIESDPAIGNFSIASRKAINAYLRFPERTKAFSILLRSLGFDVSCVDIASEERHSGSSSYTLRKLLVLSADIAISHSDKPLWIMIGFGFFLSAISLIFAGYQFFRWLIADVSVEGWASLIVSIWFLGGMIIALVGIVGVYVAKTFDETKARPLYLVDKVLR